MESNCLICRFFNEFTQECTKDKDTPKTDCKDYQEDKYYKEYIRELKFNGYSGIHKNE